MTDSVNAHHSRPTTKSLTLVTVKAMKFLPGKVVLSITLRTAGQDLCLTSMKLMAFVSLCLTALTRWRTVEDVRLMISMARLSVNPTWLLPLVNVVLNVMPASCKLVTTVSLNKNPSTVQSLLKLVGILLLT